MVDDHPTLPTEKQNASQLQIIPLNNSLTATDGKVSVQVLFEGEPLANAKVIAMRRETPEREPIILDTHTDAQGKARITLESDGQWLISAVHMAATNSGNEAELRSYWASLSFNAMSGQEANTRRASAPSAA